MSSRKKSSSSASKKEKKGSSKTSTRKSTPSREVEEEPPLSFIVDSDEELDYPEPILIMDTSDRPKRSALAGSKKSTGRTSSKKSGVRIGEPRVREYVKGSASADLGDSDYYDSPKERAEREARYRKAARRQRRAERAAAAEAEKKNDPDAQRNFVLEELLAPFPVNRPTPQGFEPSVATEDSGERLREREELLYLITSKMNLAPKPPAGVVALVDRTATRRGGLLPRDLAEIRSFDSPNFIDASQIPAIEKLLASAGSQGTEVELSFGVFDLKAADGTDPKFFPGVLSVDQFNSVVRGLQGLVTAGIFRSSVETDVVEIEENSLEGTGERRAIRKITKIAGGGCVADPESLPDSEVTVTWEEKTRGFSNGVSNMAWGYRISSSKEVKLARPQSGFRPTIKRNRTRTSFVASRSKSNYPGFVVDCTQVRTTVAGSPSSATRFEIEIEVTDSKKASVRGLERLIGDVLRLMQTPALPIPEFIPTPFEYGPDGDYGDDAAIAYEKEETAFLKIQAEKAKSHSEAVLKIPKVSLMTLKERELATLLHNNLFVRSFASAKPFVLAKNYTNKPINIRLDDLLIPGVSDRYAVTVKLNGVRSMILIADTGVYAYRPPFDVSKRSSNGSSEYSGTLLDCEEYFHVNPKTGVKTLTYYAFDVLFFKGEDVRQSPLVERLAKVKLAAAAANSSISRVADVNVAVTAKEFFMDPKQTVYDRVVAATERYNRMLDEGYSLDGLIFQPPGDYVNDKTKKWKPEDEMSIDVLLRRTQNGYVDEFDIMVGGFGRVDARSAPSDVIFRGSARHPAPSTMIIPGGMVDGLCADGLVVEVKFDSSRNPDRSPSGEWVIFRHRSDRDRPNRIDVAQEVWRDIVSPVNINDIKGRTLKLMRIFHNRFKSSLISKEFSEGHTILDLGFGRGGDFGKYEAAGVAKIWAVEPNVKNLEEAKRRIKERTIEVDRFNAKNRDRKPAKVPKVSFIRDDSGGGVLVGAQNTDVILDQIGERSVDGVVSMFSLTFLAENEDTMDGFVETVDRALPKGGKFVGMVMDGDRTKSLLRVEAAPPVKISKRKADALKAIENSSRGSENLSTDANGLKTYDVPPFRIRQTTDFTDHNNPDEMAFYTGDEISVLIRDPDTIVGIDDQTGEVPEEGQREWLVFFEDLKSRLAKKGIHLAKNERGFRTGFLDKGVTYELLPKDSQTYSKLVRYFVFERPDRAGRKVETQDPDFGKAVPFYVKGYEGDDLYLFGVDRGMDSFLHAVLWELSEQFRDETMTAEDRELMVRRARVRMARTLTFDRFLTLGGGSVADRFSRLAYPKSGYISQTQAQKRGMEKFIEILRDRNTFLGRDLISDLASDVFDANIFVLDGQGRVLKGTTTANFSENRPTAIVVTRDAGTTFSPLVRGVSGGFESTGEDYELARNRVVLEAVLRQISNRPFDPEAEEAEPIVEDSDSD